MKQKPVLPLVVSMALPMTLSMLVNSLYNIVDSIFVARLQIPAHLTTHSAKNWSVFPDVAERISASADQ